MKNAERGEVWLVNLGMAAKVRPCLVLSIPLDDEDRALVTLVPHTTRARGSRFEVDARCRFLQPGVFDAQNLQTVPRAKLIRRLGKLTSALMRPVEDAILQWLGFTDPG
jgi:mRNA interferase MazF